MSSSTNEIRGERRPHRRGGPPLRHAIAAACLAPALLAGAARGAPRVRIELRPGVEVDHARVTLADVASLDARDAGDLRRLSELPLGKLPAAGASVRLERDRLLPWIRAHIGLEAGEVAWTGPGAVEVRRAVRAVSGQEIAERAVESVRARLSRPGARVEVHVARPPNGVTVPAGRIALEVRGVPEQEIVPKHVSAWVDVHSDEASFRTVPVQLEVHVFRPAYVAAADAPVGRVLDAAAFEVREIEWTGRASPPVAPGAAGLVRLRRPLSAGQIVTRDHLEPAPLVTRGGWATLLATQGLVTLESRVEVLPDGRSGQMVQVRIPDAHAAILARVTGPGVVEVVP